MRAILCLLVLAAAAVAPAAAVAADPASAPTPYTRPHVRAITGFVRLDRSRYTQQIGETLRVLRAAREQFVQQGYEVQTLRIVTQPLGELIKGLSDADALAFLKSLDQLSVKEQFLGNIGPGMLHDSDDPHDHACLGTGTVDAARPERQRHHCR